MPKYTLPEMDAPAFQDLPAFVQGYIQAMFFTNQSCIPMVDFHTEESQRLIREGQADGCLPQDAGFLDLHPDALAEIVRDCVEFQKAAAVPLSYVLAIHAGAPLYSEEQAGIDFWYTRNHHGVGYWDRGLGALGDQLTEIAHKAGEVDPWFSEEPDESSPTGYGFVYHSM